MKDEIQRLYYLREKFPDSLHGGGCFGPLTVVSDILGTETMLRKIVKDPVFVERLLDYVTEYIVEIAQREKKENIGFFWIAEPVASLIAQNKFWQFSGKYIKRIYEASGVPGFLHVCGKTTMHTPYLLETGLQVLSIDYCTDIGKCIRMVPNDVIIMGNVNPGTLLWGTKAEIQKEVQDILDACDGFDNFILSTGCSVMDGTPEENVNILFEMCS